MMRAERYKCFSILNTDYSKHDTGSKLGELLQINKILQDAKPDK